MRALVLINGSAGTRQKSGGQGNGNPGERSTHLCEDVSRNVTPSEPFLPRVRERNRRIEVGSGNWTKRQNQSD